MTAGTSVVVAARTGHESRMTKASSPSAPANGASPDDLGRFASGKVAVGDSPRSRYERAPGL